MERQTLATGLAILAALLSACSEMTAPPPGERLEHNGQVFFLDGATLRDAAGRVVAENGPALAEQMHNVLASTRAVEKLRHAMLDSPRGKAAMLHYEIGWGLDGAMGQPDFCTEALILIYNLTRQYEAAQVEYWALYWSMVAVGWSGSFDDLPNVKVPDAAKVATVITLGVGVMNLRLRLDMLAMQVRAAGCLL